ncbi:MULTISPECIES: GntR family transcriptional regulator [unclassified Curtobacterium]|jgi:DNA-binding GntR family transcriptional regulator|uniref:GntR family transcriptional regulator n=1 Tax=unclassified Curtobacterium TaxID=257496 RepID=UPI001AE8FB80|nr:MULTISPECIES: GntR family transcriptional regulator [unclassified Curtobacterium]MBP1301831.1 DNA-binding GntR family transcriptional regulator [Curtobacterium sp. 1310]MCM3503971.1 GntR family transcriptional regulator [Curtobacterium sp. ODYSSEY 48 V2]MCM3522687.1 GntR family transcriptional regulator [Curtobacterium sp. P97]MDB6426242.1 GntR family transcriptional regulator [Curtobacterium sp. 20TX0008]MDT0210158.1 GntR family transcriptional regulator [Curtobacterium sp. BRD11]
MTSTMPGFGSARITQIGLRDRVYDRVLEVLMGHDVEPGMRLSIDGLARTLGVSPTPVREALVQLERTGLVTREANKGYRVAPPLAGDQLEALFDARLIVESGAVELAARGDVAVLRERLAAALAEQEAVAAEVARVGARRASEELMARFFRSDWRFHQLVFDATRNPFLEEMSAIITTRVHRMRQIVEGGDDDTERAVAEHRAVLDALAVDAPTAVAAMRHHIDAVRVRSRADASHSA